MKQKNSGFTASGLARPEIRPGDIFKDKYGGRITIKTVDDFRVTYIREGYEHPCVSSHMRLRVNSPGKQSTTSELKRHRQNHARYRYGTH
ncbi:DUF4222 domain-containing protein [Escherichia coli]|uniref:DUF4222 domain-containing protein n=1 Tax=Escherichia coli TaxID=562 RepID=UPI002FCD338C